MKNTLKWVGLVYVSGVIFFYLKRFNNMPVEPDGTKQLPPVNADLLLWPLIPFIGVT